MGFIPCQENDEPDAQIMSLLVRSARRNVAVSFDVDHMALQRSGSARVDFASQLWAAVN